MHSPRTTRVANAFKQLNPLRMKIRPAARREHVSVGYVGTPPRFRANPAAGGSGMPARFTREPHLDIGQLVPDGVPDDVDDRMQVQFLHDRRAMGFHRLRRDTEDRCDLTVGLAFR